MIDYDKADSRDYDRSRNVGCGMRLPPALSSSTSHSLSVSSALSTPARAEEPLVASSSFCSSSSWKSRCKRTGDFCAAGHELIKIPVVDRQRFLQRQEWLLQQQEEQGLRCNYHPHEAPLFVSEPNKTSASSLASTSIIIECDCCSKNMFRDQYIEGCCLECDIDVCGDCFKKGQSYIDVVLKESCENDMHDDHCQKHQEQFRENHHHERHNRHRPTYIGTGRVNYDDYPDPTVWSWSFTGSSDPNASVAPIEYFEKDFGKEVGVIWLDFYYTIGTVHTFIVVDGTVRELFTKSQQKMSKQSYHKILKDPRSYRNERYKKGKRYYQERRR